MHGLGLGLDKSRYLPIAAPPPPPATIATLPVGVATMGSWTATTVPADQGNPADWNYGCKIKMQWDFVPMQDADDTYMYIGCYAYQQPSYAQYAAGIKNAVASVTFIAANGAPVVVTTPVTNPATGLSDVFVVKIDRTAASRDIEIRAIGTPLTGKCRVMQGIPAISSSVEWADYDNPSQILAMNADGSRTRPTYYLAASGGNNSNSGTSPAAPLANMDGVAAKITALALSDVGGVHVKLLAGTYTNFGVSTFSTMYPTANRWFTIEANDGLNLGDVVIASYQNAVGFPTRGAPYLDAIPFPATNVRYRKIATNGTPLYFTGGSITYQTTASWIDTCDILGTTATDGASLAAFAMAPSVGKNNGGFWMTNTTTRGFKTGHTGSHGVLIRSCHTSYVADDVMSQVRCIIDTGWDNCINGGTHPDVYQSQGPNTRKNYMLHTLHGTPTPGNEAQIIFGDTGSTWNEWACIDCYLGKSTGAKFAIGNEPQDFFGLRIDMSDSGSGAEVLNWNGVATYTRFVDCLYVNNSHTYKQGVSYLYPTMVPGEPFDGVPVESILSTATTPENLAAKQQYIWDSTRTHHTTMLVDETGQYVTAWTRATSAAGGPTGVGVQTLNATGTFYPYVGNRDGVPVMLVHYDSTSNDIAWFGTNTVIQQLASTNAGELFVAIYENGPAPADTTNRFIFITGNTTTATRMRLWRTSNGTKISYTMDQPINSAAQTYAIPNASVAGTNGFSGWNIIHFRKGTTDAQLTVYDVNNPAGVSTGSVSYGGANSTVPTTGITKFFSGNANPASTSYHWGELAIVAVYSTLTNNERSDVIARIKGLLGIIW